jgi:hypothetical protein
MTDQVKDRDNKDAEESGRPVQLDREEQGSKPGQQQGGQQQGGQHKPQQDREPGQQPAPHPGQQPAQHR